MSDRDFPPHDFPGEDDEEDEDEPTVPRDANAAQSTESDIS
jgi:hypothetical protein